MAKHDFHLTIKVNETSRQSASRYADHTLLVQTQYLYNEWRIKRRKTRSLNFTRKFPFFCLDMEDHYSPCWPAAPSEANWVQTSDAVYDESLLVPCPSHASASANFQVNGFPSWIQDASENRAASGSKSHSQAEKRRRDRINEQLGILRKLIPKSEKVHKHVLTLHKHELISITSTAWLDISVNY